MASHPTSQGRALGTMVPLVQLRSSSRGCPIASRSKASRLGMSLMEMMVAMALLAGILGLSMPYISNMLGVEVREESRELAQTTRYLFDRASITGQTYRIAFNLDRHAYWIEVNDSEEGVLIYESARAKEDGEERMEDLIEAIEKSRDQGMKRRDGAGAALPIADKVLRSFNRVPEDEIKPVVFPDTVFLEGVWTPQYEEVQRPREEPPEDEADDQIVYLHLFPGGYAERAYIYISDGDEDFYTLEVEPLTGRVVIIDEEVEVPREWRRR